MLYTLVLTPGLFQLPTSLWQLCRHSVKQTKNYLKPAFLRSFFFFFPPVCYIICTLRDTILENSFLEKALRVLVNIKPNLNQQCAIAARILLLAALGSRSGEVILPLYSALVSLHLGCCVQFWALQPKRDMHIMERVQWRAERLEYLSCERRLRELGLLSLKKRRIGMIL